MSGRKTSAQKWRSAFSIVAVTLLSIYALSLIFALLWALVNSFKTALDFKHNPFGFPARWEFANYAHAMNEMTVAIESGAGQREVNMWEMLFNTLVYAVGCTVFGTVVPCITSYIVAKYRFPGRNLLYSIVIVTMILPIVGSLPSEIQIVYAIGFYNNLVGIWLMKGTFLGMYFLVFYAAFKSFSWDYAEAAFIDGASHFTVMARIMLPLARSTILAVGLLVFIGFWNDYMTQLLYLPSMPSISYALWRLAVDPSAGGSTYAKLVPVQLAGCILVSIPIFVLYMAFKNQLIGNLAVGGIKG